MLKANNVQLIDVREPHEVKAGKIEGSVNIPLGDVEEAFLMSDEEFKKTYHIPKPKKSDGNLVFSCRSGVRSMRALKTVENLGYKGAWNLKGGYMAWEKAFKQDL
ncbi:unnamed protein product [Echinostoma caproni]|uniref:Rhodanese domain-containing protein n=1 Tax=Echinostoma caproni TaxID=27848 RepID=A0A183BAA3_9TREM|nr:unnamed protein product [Echinostoma caproni]